MREGGIDHGSSNEEPPERSRVQRRMPRHAVDGVVGVVDPPIEGHLLDLSNHGACVLLRTGQPLGDQLTLSIQTKQVTTVLYCIVRWQRLVEDRCIAGVEFGTPLQLTTPE